MTRWLVTGAAGFLGASLTRALAADGEPVVGLDCFDEGYDPRLKAARARWVQQLTGEPVARVDVRDGASLGALLDRARPDVVVHLAARAGVRPSQADPLGYLDSNVTGFGHVLERCAAAGVGHLVYASSSSVYGETTPRPFRAEAAADHPVSPYAATKRMNELQAHVASHLHGPPTTGLRFFTAYGPWGRPDMAYFSFAEAMLAGREITVFGDGSARRDFTYVDDVVSAVRRVAACAPSGQPGWNPEHDGMASSVAPWRVLNVGLGEPVSVGQLLDRLEKLLGVPARRRHVARLADEVSATHADTSGLKSLIGDVPTTPLEAGLVRFTGWLREYHENAAGDPA